MAKNKQTFTIDANLDISQFLANYKKMIATMKQQGGDQNALASMEKTFDNLTKRANTLEAASKQTFSNSKEIERYQQKVENLKKDILTAGTAMQTFASSSANFDSKELENAQKELQKIIKQINDVKKTQQTQVASGLGDLGFKNAKDLAKQIDSQEELNKALEKEYDIRSQTKRNLQQERNAKIASINQKYADNSVVKTSDFKAGTDKANNADALNTDIQIMMSLGANSRQIMEQLEEDHEDILGDLKQQIDLEQRLNVLLQERDALVESTKTSYDNRINEVEDAQYRLGNKSSGQFEASTEAQRAFRGVDFAGDAATIQNLQGQATSQRTNINDLTQAQQNQGEQTRRNTEDIRENNRALGESVDAYSDVVDETRETTERQEELNNSFDNMKDTVKTLLSVGTAISSIKDVILNTYEDVKELDKSFAEIAMVTDYSVEEMWSSYDQYAEMANELGQTTQSVIQASGLFYQQGLQTNEALELTEDTMKLATLAGLDFEKATSQMTAALRGFHMEMDEGNRVTDVYSELAAKAAADVEGIAYAMSKTASIASSAGMEFETTSAFLTQMIETTQEAPENIGTAMKTIKGSGL